MASATPTSVRPSHRRPSTTSREHVLSQLFLFAGPAVAFVVAVLFVR